MTSAAHPIRSVAVLGAGTMGAQIAAHFANAGVPALLLDLTADVAREGLKRARALKPEPFFTPDTAALITTGGFDTDLKTLAGADWILEAVVEQLDVKRALLEQVDDVRRVGTIVSSNTSSTRRAICISSKSSRPPKPIPSSSSACRRLPITGSGKASSSRRTRRTSSPITSACTA